MSFQQCESKGLRGKLFSEGWNGTPFVLKDMETQNRPSCRPTWAKAFRWTGYATIDEALRAILGKPTVEEGLSGVASSLSIT